MFDRDSEPLTVQTGESFHDGLIALWRHHLRDGLQEDGRDTFTAFDLHLLPNGERYHMPRCSAWPEGAARIKAWAAGANELDFLATEYARIFFNAEELYRRAAESSGYLPGNPRLPAH